MEEKARAARKAPFTDEFKAGAVRLVLDEGKKVAQVARDLGLAPSSLLGKTPRPTGAAARPGLPARSARSCAVLRELRVVRMERDILKKAAAFFAKENA